MTQKKKEKIISKYLRKLYAAVNGAEMHRNGAIADKNIIFESRLRMKEVLRSSDVAERVQLSRNIAYAKESFQESASLYNEQIKKISNLIKQLDDPTSKIFNAVDDLEAFKAKVLRIVEGYYGDSKLSFPFPPI